MIKRLQKNELFNPRNTGYFFFKNYQKGQLTLALNIAWKQFPGHFVVEIIMGRRLCTLICAMFFLHI